MTDKQFVAAVEAYYGKYEHPQVKASVLSFIGQFGNIGEIYDRLILEFSGQYRFVPDVAVIKRIITNLRQEDPDGIYRRGRRIGHMDGSRFIPDLSLLSPGAFREYAQKHVYYDNPSGFLQLLKADKGGELDADQSKAKQLQIEGAKK